MLYMVLTRNNNYKHMNSSLTSVTIDQKTNI